MTAKAVPRCQPFHRTLCLNISSILNPNSHQNSHLSKTKKATFRVASITYSFLWCLWLLR
jgi:hypothetical protein